MTTMCNMLVDSNLLFNFCQFYLLYLNLHICQTKLFMNGTIQQDFLQWKKHYISEPFPNDNHLPHVTIEHLKCHYCYWEKEF